MISPEFLLTSLVFVLIPGTGTIYTVSTGLFYGWRASLAAAVGCTAGIVPHLLASIFGLAFVLHMSALVFQGIKFAGATYLLYLAWALWREQGVLNLASASPEKNARQIIMKAVWLNLLNPKLTLFFFAFLPLSVSPGAALPLAELLLLSVVFMGITWLYLSAMAFWRAGYATMSSIRQASSSGLGGPSRPSLPSSVSGSP